MATKRNSFLRNNALSLVLFILIIGSVAGQIATGWRVYNAERADEGATALSLSQYVGSGHFVSATFENWESEFLQMAMYVLLTVSLRQRGSAESRPMSPEEEEERIEEGPTPWAARAGGVWRTLYGHSLAIAFALLFVLSFALHVSGSWRRELAERAMKGDDPVPLGTYLQEPQFWFESFQNWQSEFLAVFALVVLTIWLRQKDSPQSKPLDAPHSQTGT